MKHDVLRPVTLVLLLELLMKLIVLAILFSLFGVALMADTEKSKVNHK